MSAKRFEEMFPLATVGEVKEYEGNSVMRASTPGRCLCCGGPASWLDLFFETAVCTPACLDEAWRKYGETQDYEQADWQNYYG